MAEETPIRKPLIKKVEEIIPEPKQEETPVVKMEPVKVEEASKPAGPKRGRCKTKCWVQKRLFEVGEETTFEPGEFIPEHFTIIE